VTDVRPGVRDGDLVILREDDPRAGRLQAEGWTVTSASWGARLVVRDDMLDQLEAAAHRVDGICRVVRLGPLDAPAIAGLDQESIEDYPAGSAATAHEPADATVLATHLAADWRAYGAVLPDGSLGSVTVMRPDDQRIETEFTVTAAAVRRQGLAGAVKAFGILDHVGLGHRVFGTGGHAANVASLRVNQQLGYELEPRWLSLRRL
jgi:hypothetical protein